MDYGRKLFYIFGIGFGLFTIFLLVVSLMVNEPPLMITYLSLAKMIMCFCIGYLNPQFKQKDERMKLIREKGMFASFIAIMVYLLIFILILQFELITISSIHLLQLLVILVILTVSISFVVYSKIY